MHSGIVLLLLALLAGAWSQTCDQSLVGCNCGEPSHLECDQCSCCAQPRGPRADFRCCKQGAFGNGLRDACELCGSGTARDPSQVCGGTVGHRWWDTQGCDSSLCQPCEAGKIRSQSSPGGCTNCPSGQFQDEAGQSSCKNCTAGRYGAGDSPSACIACEAGQFQDEAGQSSCKNCTAGRYGAGDSPSACIVCEAGQFQDEAGQSSCKNCTAGKTSEEGAGQCKAKCQPWQFNAPEVAGLPYESDDCVGIWPVLVSFTLVYVGAFVACLLRQLSVQAPKSVRDPPPPPPVRQMVPTKRTRCRKQKPTVRVWPWRYVVLEGKSLNFYDSSDGGEPRGSSIADLTDYSIEVGFEKYAFDGEQFLITLKPPTGDGDATKFSFKEELHHEMFQLAISNVVEGRSWDDKKYWSATPELTENPLASPPALPTAAESDSFALEDQDERLFRQCDKNGNGQVSYEEILAVLEDTEMKCGPYLVRQVWKKFDTDQNGQLNRAEFGLFMAELQDKALFSECDSDKDGQLDLQEAEKAISRYGFQVGDKYLRGAWDVYDLDGNGKLSMDEFLKLMKVVRQKSTVSRKRATYKQVTSSMPVCGSMETEAQETHKEEGPSWERHMLADSSFGKALRSPEQVVQQVCGKELLRYNQNHPNFRTLGGYKQFEEWSCDVCQQNYGHPKDHALYCCKTFDSCDWGVCRACLDTLMRGGGSKLPKGWASKRDVLTGRDYYFCGETEETTWRRPTQERIPQRKYFNEHVPDMNVGSSSSCVLASSHIQRFMAYPFWTALIFGYLLVYLVPFMTQNLGQHEIGLQMFSECDEDDSTLLEQIELTACLERLSFPASMIDEQRGQSEPVDLATFSEFLGLDVKIDTTLQERESGIAAWVPGKLIVGLPKQYWPSKEVSYDTYAKTVVDSKINFVYSVMHALLASVTLVPLPMCHWFWTAIGDNFPVIRKIVPLDDFEYWHKLLGYFAIGGLIVGPIVWLSSMTSSCYGEPTNPACLIFARSFSATKELPDCAKDPTCLLPEGFGRSVLVLRLFLAPLWVTVLPLMQFARQTRCKLEIAKVRQDPLQWQEFATRVWLFMAALATFTCWGFAFGGQPGMLVGAALGILLGGWSGQSPWCATNWFEICYYSHCIVAYVSIGFAVVARFKVFWPCLVCWPLLCLDKILSRLACCGECKCSRVGKYQAKMRLAEQGKNPFHCSNTWLNERAVSKTKTGKTIRLVLDKKIGDDNSPARWVKIQVPAVDRCWHPFSLANRSGQDVELLIDVHKGPGNDLTWTEKLYKHILTMNGGKGRGDHLPTEQLHAANEKRRDASVVNVSGPFGSSFSRCFAHEEYQSSYDIIILLTAGLGLPSALSALREFIETKRSSPDRVPPYVWFCWQCRHEEDLQIAWDALHWMIFDGMGERAADQSTHRYALSLRNHRAARNESWPNSFFHHENMLDWLGVTIYISKPKTYPIVAPAGDPLYDLGDSPISQHMEGETAETISIDRSVINKWLTDTRRLRKGYFSDEFSKLILWLAEDHTQTGSGARSGADAKICVSMCGRHEIAKTAQKCINDAKKKGGLNVSVEFVSETQ